MSKKTGQKIWIYIGAGIGVVVIVGILLWGFITNWGKGQSSTDQAEQKSLEANRKLKEAEQKSHEANRRLKEAEQKSQEATMKMKKVEQELEVIQQQIQPNSPPFTVDASNIVDEAAAAFDHVAYLKQRIAAKATTSQTQAAFASVTQPQAANVARIKKLQRMDAQRKMASVSQPQAGFASVSQPTPSQTTPGVAYGSKPKVGFAAVSQHAKVYLDPLKETKEDEDEIRYLTL